MDEQTNATDERRKKAMARYDAQVKFYERTKTHARCMYRLCETLVIVFSGITPVLILLTDSKFWQAVFPAAASILAGISGVWQFREAWRRRVRALEALKCEFLKFDTKSGEDYRSPTSDDQAIERFILKMESIIADEIAEWHGRTEQTGTPKSA